MAAISLSDEQFATLQKRGTNYVKVLGVSWDQIDEVLGRAYLKLCEFLIALPDTEDQWTNAENVWRRVVKQSVTDDWRQTRFAEVTDKAGMMMQTEGPEVDHERVDWQRAVLSKAYDILSEDHMLVLIAFCDCNLNIAETAKYLNMQRTNLYHVLRKIRASIQAFFPEHKEVVKATFTQKYVAKYTGLLKDDVCGWQRDPSLWSRFLMAVECVDYLPYTPAFFDPSESEQIGEVTHVTGIERSAESFVPNSSTVSHSEQAMFEKYRRIA